MIMDLEKFLRKERPYWQELEAMLQGMEQDGSHRLDMTAVKRFHYLYQRASADLGQLMTFSAEQSIRRYLEDLVARAYGEIHAVRAKTHRFSPLLWFFKTFPITFRRHINAFYLVAAVTLAGMLFGGAAVGVDPGAKATLLPFDHLHGTPSERVAREMETKGKHLRGHQAQFSTYLMANNIRVSITAMALGLTYGIGTLIVLLYNGIILGAVAADYILDGQTVFLFGWLLPHGSIEIPAFLLAGQAGLVLAHGLIGKGNRLARRERLRRITPDLTTLIFGIGLMLIWAGIIESFLSQYHEPVLPYWLKIGFGSAQLVLLVLFLSMSGKKYEREHGRDQI